MSILSTTNPWVRCLKPNPDAKLRLFCFPYAGGKASLFRLWADYLPSAVELYAIQLPGRGERLREPLFTYLPLLIQHLLPNLVGFFDLPFAFFGHSLGALISFEVARQLKKQTGPHLDYLFVSGYRAPHLSNPKPPRYQLSDSSLIDELRRLQGTSEAILQNTELMQLTFPTLRADLALCDTYTYLEEEPLDCPIAVFGGTKDLETCRQELEAWKVQTNNIFKLRMYPGDHFFLHNTQLSLLQDLSKELTWLLSQ